LAFSDTKSKKYEMRCFTFGAILEDDIVTS